MDPEQEIFTELLVKLREKFGTDMVHDGFLPPDGTPYPFIYLAESQLIDSANKSAVFGNVYQSTMIRIKEAACRKYCLKLRKFAEASSILTTSHGMFAE